MKDIKNKGKQEQDNNNEATITRILVKTRKRTT